MTLYHFLPAHMVTAVQKSGLTLGRFPIVSTARMTFIDGLQWLTSEPDPDKQSWATSMVIPYSRTAYRLTIEIPKSGVRRLIKATEFVRGLAVVNRALLENWAGSDCWYIYRGAIPPGWIKQVEKMNQEEFNGRV